MRDESTFGNNSQATSSAALLSLPSPTGCGSTERCCSMVPRHLPLCWPKVYGTLCATRSTLHTLTHVQAKQLSASLCVAVSGQLSRVLKAAMASPASPADSLDAPGAIAALTALQRELAVLGGVLASLLAGPGSVELRREALVAVFAPVVSTTGAPRLPTLLLHALLRPLRTPPAYTHSVRHQCTHQGPILGQHRCLYSPVQDHTQHLNRVSSLIHVVSLNHVLSL